MLVKKKLKKPTAQQPYSKQVCLFWQQEFPDSYIPTFIPELPTFSYFQQWPLLSALLAFQSVSYIHAWVHGSLVSFPQQIPCKDYLEYKTC